MISEPLIKRFENIRWSAEIGFDFHGTKIGFKVEDAGLVEKVRRILPAGSFEIDFGEIKDYFLLITGQETGVNGFFWVENSIPEPAFEFDRFEETCWAGIEVKILFTLAMVSPPKMFYFHAGAVAINGKGIVIPGRTFSGKTTLTKEFIRNGADYYSDDCALIDSEGFLHPYPIKLGIRNENERDYLDVADFGARAGIEPVKIDFFLFTQYKKGSIWMPQIKPLGQFSFQLLEHLFYPPSMNRKPAETMRLAARLAAETEVVESLRGESAEVVEWFFEYFEKSVR